MARRSYFGSFQIDLDACALYRDHAPVSIQRQPFEILALLLERPGQLVTREELRARLWRDGTFVDFEHGLNTAVRKVRRALGDAADAPRYIETVPRRGYRLIAARSADRVSHGLGPVLLAAQLVSAEASPEPLQAFQRVVAVHGGEWLGASGSEASAAFTDPQAGLFCGLELQSGSAGRSALWRVGVALGGPETARAHSVALRDVARPGELLCTRAFAARLEDSQELHFRDVATGVAEPATACAVEMRADAQADAIP